MKIPESKLVIFLLPESKLVSDPGVTRLIAENRRKLIKGKKSWTHNPITGVYRCPDCDFWWRTSINRPETIKYATIIKSGKCPGCGSSKTG